MAETWHHGLIARWWAEVNQRDTPELDYVRAAIARHGEPALDLGCGTGRLLVPLLADGLDVDGLDASADMLDHAATAIAALGMDAGARLHLASFDELATGRRYGTIFSVGGFGVGATVARDAVALRRVREHLLPGGAAVLGVETASDDDHARMGDPARPYPRPWPDQEDRATLADGDVLVLAKRAVGYETASRTHHLEIRARLERDGEVVARESGLLANTYYRPEDLTTMLLGAGFTTVTVEGPYTGEPPAPTDDTLVIVAR